MCGDVGGCCVMCVFVSSKQEIGGGVCYYRD